MTKRKTRQQKINASEPIGQSVIPVDENEIVDHSSEGGLAGIFQRSRYNNDNPLVPSYWSRDRDKKLIELTLRSDYLKTAYNNAMFLLLGMEFNYSADDPDDLIAVRQKEILELTIDHCLSNDELVPFLFDLWSTDMGGFLEILSVDGATAIDMQDGVRKTLPIEPIEVENNIFLGGVGFRHLESLRCTRTGNSEYPIIYKHTDGYDYHMHRTRVFFTQQLKSPDKKLKGIGLCVTSRILDNLTQNRANETLLIDQSYDGMVGGIIAGYPFTAEALRNVFEETEIRRNTLYDKAKRHLKYLLVGSPKEIPHFEKLELRRLPENFVKSEEMENMFFLISSTLGVDARFLWPVKSTTLADAEQSNRQFRQKLPQWWIDTFTLLMEQFILPQGVSITNNYNDTQQQMEIDQSHAILSESLQRDILQGIISELTALEIYRARGIITDHQFERERERLENPITPLPITSGQIPNVQQGGEQLFASKDILYVDEETGRVVTYTAADLQRAFSNAPDNLRQLIND